MMFLVSQSALHAAIAGMLLYHLSVYEIRKVARFLAIQLVELYICGMNVNPFCGYKQVIQVARDLPCSGREVCVCQAPESP